MPDIEKTTENWNQDDDFFDSEEFIEFAKTNPIQQRESRNTVEYDPNELEYDQSAEEIIEKVDNNADTLMPAAEKMLQNDFDDGITDLKNCLSEMLGVGYTPDISIMDDHTKRNGPDRAIYSSEKNRITYYHGKESITETAGSLAQALWSARQEEDGRNIDGMTDSEKYAAELEARLIESKVRHIFRREIFLQNPQLAQDLARRHTQNIKRISRGDFISRDAIDGFDIDDCREAHDFIKPKKFGEKIAHALSIARRKGA